MYFEFYLVKCSFATEYYNYEKMQFLTFQCEEESQDNGLCIFHDPGYLNYKADYQYRDTIVRDRLASILNDKNDANEPVYLIGCYLPTIEIKGFIFSNSVYFKESTFNGIADFSESKFLKRAVFSKCKFNDLANFCKCEFCQIADFSDACFLNTVAVFDHVTFSQAAVYVRGFL